MSSFLGKLLVVDLSARAAREVSLDPELCRRYLGGIGMATKLLWDYSRPRTDPFSPENPLVFAAGPLAGTMAPSGSKYAVATKSPLTGFIGDSLSSGGWPLALKRAGYDAMVVQGAADVPTYVFVDDDRVYFRSARRLWGGKCWETEEAIRRELGDDGVRVATVGPAGERLVRYACIGNDYGRQAGRTGPGAVMGSKNLKAIAVRGTKPVGVSDPGRVKAASLDLYARSQGAATTKYRVLGTPANVLALDALAALPAYNFRQSTFEKANRVSGEYFYERFKAKVVACAGCPIGCDHIYRVTDGQYAGTEVGMDYESLYALGPLCGIDDAAAILKASELCDQYGLDTMSTGASIAWAMESYERGLISRDEAEGLDLRFGSAEAVVTMVEQIGLRRGLGRLLGEGVRRAAATLGSGSDFWAMHVKGLELPGYEPRSLKTLALGLAVGTRGACHNRSAGYEVDLSAKVDRLSSERGRGPLAMAQEDYAATLDSLGVCKFLRRCFDAFHVEAADLFRATTGLELTAEELQKVGERVSNLKKAYNIREGWTRADDTLPPRILEEKLPTGVARGTGLTRSELDEMIDGYYEARGWTTEGLIPPAKLAELGMEELGAGVSEGASDAKTLHSM
ncbi:MAG TPA: aldehyde ferredoxin oxidoreductase family protein [Chloroflexota bacterium]|nr:aldehyde ferredoxin oxidoreductase family protein [Chloroflexota bacterium]